MFGFLLNMGNYDERKVARFQNEELMVSTAAVNDSSKPFETAVLHPSYNDNNIVIVAEYDTREEAEIGHDKWVVAMTAEKLPTVLEDVSSCEVVQFGLALGFDVRSIAERKIK